jgi:phosphoserine phosphatase RsbU/P
LEVSLKLLIAEDDALFLHLITETLATEHELLVAKDGAQAWRVLEQPNPPRLAILDWVMPELSGPEICRKVRQTPHLSSMYLIILTARNSTPDVISGLQAGADDYVTKPFHPEELRARVKVGERIVALQCTLAAQLFALEDVLGQQKQLEAVLASCPYGKTVRSGEGYWSEIQHCAAQLPLEHSGEELGIKEGHWPCEVLHDLK